MSNGIGPQAGASSIVGSSSLPTNPTFRQVYVTPSGVYVCFSDGVWTLLEAGSATGEVTGGGTTNRLTKWSNGPGSIIGDSALLDDGVTVNSIRPFTASNVSAGFATTATAAQTTTLTVASKGIQEFTGSTTQTVVLPVVSTLPQTGFQFVVINRSSGVVTVESSGANSIQAMAANTTAIFTCVALTGTGASSWDVTYIATGGGASYSVYTATLNQSGTDAPVATVLQNTLGGVVVWTRQSAGTYVATLTGAFTVNKTWASISLTAGSLVGIQPNDVNSVIVSVPDGDDILTNNAMEIRVYP